MSRRHTLHYAGMPAKVASPGRAVARHYAGRVAIDLHTHSTASDGTEAPAVVVERAVEAGLTTLALTDHDTTKGWAEAGDAARRARHPAGAAASRSRAPGATGASTCWPTCPTPTTPTWSASSSGPDTAATPAWTGWSG